LKFVALRVPEIKGGTGQITWWRHLWRHEACIDYPCDRLDAPCIRWLCYNMV